MITSLPDLFIDILIKNIKINKNTGNINKDIIIKLGGNAGNFSLALAKLNIENNLIAGCNKLLEYYFKNYIDDHKLKINFLPVYKDISITISFENDDDRTMITDPKGIQIDDQDIKEYYNLISKSDYIFFGNWNNNKKSNKLLKYVLDTNNKIYLDMGDPSVNKENLEEFIEIIKEKKIWVLGLNDYELKYLGKYIGIKGSIQYISNRIYNEFNLEHLDVHSPDFVYTLPSDKYIEIKKIKPKIITGVGDYWNAGNFYGYINNFDDSERLNFANNFAKMYISKKIEI
ncbi:ribokinase-like domain-containing protein [Nanobdella aerobiophila]|uniref:Ribokinase-like domain-containing protein n=1 Tax=Nanobdella aerobiophila TaxID=2586965 RepID=A0A915WRG5_9ARCH|nr:hypothetical protein [Nanobdella aerobiophila]BBL45603.1 ribokinase-like domain-containing protein [Nanobdella aerobiophila]